MKSNVLQFASMIAFFAIFFLSSCEKDPIVPDVVIDDEIITPVPTTPDQKIETAVLVADYQDLFELRKREGYRPVWIDGFLHRTGVANDAYNVTMFNVIFEKAENNLTWASYHGMTGAAYQAKFDQMKDAGYRPEFVESYPYNGGIRYAAIFVKTAGPAYSAIHGMPIANWQAHFDTKLDQGYRLVNRSVVVKNGSKFVTALFDKKDVGSWISKSNQTPAQTQTLMENNKAQGRPLSHMDISQTTASDYTFGVIFNSEEHNGWYALNALDQQELEDEIATAKSNGYATTVVCAYDIDTLINGNEVNQIRYAVGFKK